MKLLILTGLNDFVFLFYVFMTITYNECIATALVILTHRCLQIFGANILECQSDHRKFEPRVAHTISSMHCNLIEEKYEDLFIWGFTSLSTLYRSYHDG